jgi:hypothetical protein
MGKNKKDEFASLKMGLEETFENTLKMDFDVTNAVDFTNSQGQVMIVDIIQAGDEFQNKYIGVQKNIKYKEKLIDVGVGKTYIQKTNNKPSAVALSGGSTLTDIDIEVVELAVKEGYEPNELNPKIAGLLLAAGSSPDNPLPLKDIVISLKGLEVSRFNSYQLWQGNKTGSTQNMNNFDGWLTLIKKSSDVTSGGTIHAFDASTVLADMVKFNNVVISKFPAWINNGYAVFMSPSQFQCFYQTKFAQNGVVDALTLAAGVTKTSFTFNNVTYYSMQGMIGSNQIVATRLGCLTVGTDLISETDTVKFEFLREAEIYRLEIIYKLGAQIAREKEVIATL